MTCIVGYKHKGKVYLAGDQVGGSVYFREKHSSLSKVFKVGDFLIGYTDSFRMGQILQYSWTPPTKKVGQDDDSFIFRDFVNSLFSVYESCKYGNRDGVEYKTGKFLMGWNGRLFTVQPNLSILEHDSYAACGCGEDFARGAIYSLLNYAVIGDRPKDLLEAAILSAAEHSPGVGQTVTFVEG